VFNENLVMNYYEGVSGRGQFRRSNHQHRLDDGSWNRLQICGGRFSQVINSNTGFHSNNRYDGKPISQTVSYDNFLVGRPVRAGEFIGFVGGGLLDPGAGQIRGSEFPQNRGHVGEHKVVGETQVRGERRTSQHNLFNRIGRHHVLLTDYQDVEEYDLPAARAELTTARTATHTKGMTGHLTPYQVAINTLETGFILPGSITLPQWSTIVGRPAVPCTCTMCPVQPKHLCVRTHFPTDYVCTTCPPTCPTRTEVSPGVFRCPTHCKCEELKMEAITGQLSGVIANPVIQLWSAWQVPTMRGHTRPITENKIGLADRDIDILRGVNTFTQRNLHFRMFEDRRVVENNQLNDFFNSIWPSFAGSFGENGVWNLGRTVNPRNYFFNAFIDQNSPNAFEAIPAENKRYENFTRLNPGNVPDQQIGGNPYLREHAGDDFSRQFIRGIIPANNASNGHHGVDLRNYAQDATLMSGGIASGVRRFIPIHSIAAGQVISIAPCGFLVNGNTRGNTIIIQHYGRQINGHYVRSVYMHLDARDFGKGLEAARWNAQQGAWEGGHVKAGQKIGYQGMSGLEAWARTPAGQAAGTGVHLHLELRTVLQSNAAAFTEPIRLNPMAHINWGLFSCMMFKEDEDSD